jgi:hypothetical protein
MKNKIMGLLASLACIAGMLTVGIATAAPASAASCSTFLGKSNAGYYNYGDGTWHIKADVGYQICSTTTGDAYAKINQYFVTINRVSTGCGGGTVPTFGHQINGWRVNPDVLGAWNPGTKELNSCSPGVITFSPGGAIVWANSPSNIRCISGTAAPKINAWPDGGFEATIPNICVI